MINIFNPKNINKNDTNVPMNVFTQKDKKYECDKCEEEIDILNIYPNVKVQKFQEVKVKVNVPKISTTEEKYDSEIFYQVKIFIENLDIENKKYNLVELKEFAKKLKDEYMLRNININISKNMLNNLFNNIIENPSLYVPQWLKIENDFMIDIGKIRGKNGYLVKDLKNIIKTINSNLKKDMISIIGNKNDLYNSIMEYVDQYYGTED